MDGDEGVELVVGAVIPPDDVIVTEGTSTFSESNKIHAIRHRDLVMNLYRRVQIVHPARKVWKYIMQLHTKSISTSPEYMDFTHFN